MVIFILVAVILYSVLSTRTPEDTKLRQRADLVSAKVGQELTITNNLPSEIQGQEINITALELLYSRSSNYDSYKTQLGIQGDFCIVAVDELGGIISFGSNNSFGNPNDNLSLSDTSGIICGANS